MVSVTDISFGSLLPESVQQEGTTSENQEWYLCESTEDAGDDFREALRERKTDIKIMFSEENSEEDDYNALFSSIYNNALEHTGKGNEGDYLKWNLSQISASFVKSSNTFEITIAYLDDASMEEQTTQAIEKLEETLAILSGDSTYDKIYTIYDYLANDITYDKEDTSNLPHTAYDAVVNHKAVCQGYAMLFYRVLLDYGIENRIVVSDTHAWNLVYLDGEYYECDLTWDSQGVQEGLDYEFFLKADLTEGNSAHEWKTDALDESVMDLARADSDYSETGTSENSHSLKNVNVKTF
jgi:hypothetical protein